MMIDFDRLPAQKMEHFKGGEGSVTMVKYADPTMGNIIRLTLAPYSTLGLHRHVGNCEIIYCISGHGQCQDGDQVVDFLPGMCHYCPDGSEHCLLNHNSEPLVVFAVIPNTVK